MKLNIKRPPAFTHEGAKISHINPEQELRRTVMSCLLWEDNFYEGGQSVVDRIKNLIPKVSPSAVYSIASAARNQQYLRHVPLLIAREMAALPNYKHLVGSLLTDVIQRPDELCEFLAIYFKDGKKPLSAQVKKGLAAAFGKFNEYSLQKYNRPHAIKLKDVMRLVHPKPSNKDQADLWKRLLSDTLVTPDTWEVELSQSKDKRASWERLLSENKLGGLALLRNLRNFTEAKVNKDLIRRSILGMKTDKVLPFRFLAAAKYAPDFEPELEAAMFQCLKNMPKLAGKTALIVDTSPSMKDLVSAKSELTRLDAACALAILLREICEDVSIISFNKKAYKIPPRRGFALKDAIVQTVGNYSAGGLAVDMANEEGYDSVICLSDGAWHSTKNGQLATGALMDGATISSPIPNKPAYMINIACTKNGVGYGKWTVIDGWSEQIVNYIQMSKE